MSETAIVTLSGADGQKYACQILDIFEFQERQYALLLKLDGESLVIMRMSTDGSQSVFHDVQDDQEFARVCDHVHELAKAGPREGSDEHDK